LRVKTRNTAPYHPPKVKTEHSTLATLTTLTALAALTALSQQTYVPDSTLPLCQQPSKLLHPPPPTFVQFSQHSSISQKASVALRSIVGQQKSTNTHSHTRADWTASASFSTSTSTCELLLYPNPPNSLFPNIWRPSTGYSTVELPSFVTHRTQNDGSRGFPNSAAPSAGPGHSSFADKDIDSLRAFYVLQP
jgi:hypothetical protein